LGLANIFPILTFCFAAILPVLPFSLAPIFLVLPSGLPDVFVILALTTCASPPVIGSPIAIAWRVHRRVEGIHDVHRRRAYPYTHSDRRHQDTDVDTHLRAGLCREEEKSETSSDDPGSTASHDDLPGE
jgi:hypothetical protein